MQSVKSKKSTSMQSSQQVVKQPSLSHLTKRLPTKSNYKGYEIKVMYKEPWELEGMRGWISIAKKNNVYVVGADQHGKLITNPTVQSALAHICSLIDLDENAQEAHLKRTTIESLFDE